MGAKFKFGVTRLAGKGEMKVWVSRQKIALLGLVGLITSTCSLNVNVQSALALEAKSLFANLNPDKTGTLAEPFVWENFLAWRDGNKLFLLDLTTNKKIQLNDSAKSLLDHNLLTGMVFWEQQEGNDSVVYVYDIEAKLKRPLDLPNPWGTQISPEGLLYWVMINAQTGAKELVWYNIKTGSTDRHQLPLSVPNVDSFSAGARFIAWSTPMGELGHEIYAYDRLNKRYRQFGTVGNEIYPMVDGTFLVYIKVDGQSSTLQAVDLEQDIGWTVSTIETPTDTTDTSLPQVSEGNVIWVDESAATGNEQIFNHNLATGETTQVTYDASHKGDVSFQDGKLVWVDQKETADGKAEVTLRGITITAPRANFYDIVGHWAEGNIRDLIEQGLITGFKDAEGNLVFAPNQAITRAEFVTILQRALGGDKVEKASSTKFKDIGNHWARSSIVGALNAGYIRGYADNTFKPNAYITRAEIAAIMARLVNLNGEGANQAFSDIPKGHWAQEAIILVTKAGIMQGYANAEFRPAGEATRAEIATVLHRLLEKGLIKNNG